MQELCRNAFIAVYSFPRKMQSPMRTGAEKEEVIDSVMNKVDPKGIRTDLCDQTHQPRNCVLLCKIKG